MRSWGMPVSDAATDPMRAALLAEGGPLAAGLRAVDASGVGAAAVAEVWQWAGWLRIVRGLRGATTVTRYVDIVRRYLAWCQSRALNYATLRHTDVEAWQQDLYLRARNRPSWRAQQLVAVRQFYRWRAAQGIGCDCADGVRGPTIRVQTPRKYGKKELRVLLQSAAGDALQQLRDRALLLVLLCTGGRREEIAMLDLQQIEIGKRTGLVRFYGKGAKEREVAIEGPVVDQLRRWLVERERVSPIHDPDALWLSVHSGAHYGRRLRVQGVEDCVSRHARSAKLRTWGVHRFRVTFATQLYDAGYDIERIRAVMGHDSIETTRRYISVSERRRQVRASARYQRELLGFADSDLPHWAQQMEGGGASPF